MASFKDIKLPIGKKSKHNLGNTWSGSLQWGALTPIYCKMVTPGERIEYNPSILIQSPAFSTITFGRVQVSQHSFFVPSRLLWKDFQSFIVGGDNGQQTFTPPYAYLGDLAGAIGLEYTQKDNLYVVGSDIHDMFVNNDSYGRGYFSTLINGLGLLPYRQSTASVASYQNLAYTHKKISLLPFRAYQKIYWDWYRDSSLIPESQKNIFCFTDGGRKDFMMDVLSPDASTILAKDLVKELTTRHVAYDKDYFTTARTQPQSGMPSLVPVDVAGMSGSVSVSDGSLSFTASDSPIRATSITGPDYTPNSQGVYANNVYNGNSVLAMNDITGRNGTKLAFNNVYGNVEGISGELSLNSNSSSSSASFAVESLRLANAAQRFMERSNVLGTRPLAQLLGRFGVAPSAARLDMAELIGGETRNLDIIQVINQARTEQGELADRAAFGKLHFNGGKQTYYAEEHGWFLSLISIVPVTEYCDGIDRMFTMETKEDYFIPEYENLGYEAIFNYELFISLMDNDSGTDEVSPDDSFGFVPRYSWMKWKRSVLSGDFVRLNTRSDNLAWHTYRRFDNIVTASDAPVLNTAFVNVWTNDGFNNWNRLFDNTTSQYDPFKVNIFNDCICTLPMEGFAEPALANVYELDGRRIKLPYGGVRL